MTFNSNIYNRIDEALNIRTAKMMSKGWDKSRHHDMFDGKYRVYIKLPKPAEENASPIYQKYDDLNYKEKTIFNKIRWFKNEWRNTQINFLEGMMYFGENLKRKMKITKAIGQIEVRMKKIASMIENGNDEVKSDELYQNLLATKNNEGIVAYVENIFSIFKWYKDKLSQAGSKGRGEYYAVISRHPYDIAGMSTDRGWTSCQGLGPEACASFKLGGLRREPRLHSTDIHNEVNAGSLVAYLINGSDKNINRPIARMMLKTYIPGDNYYEGRRRDFNYTILDDDEFERKLMKEVRENQFGEVHDWILTVKKEFRRTRNGRVTDKYLTFNEWAEEEKENIIREIKMHTNHKKEIEWIYEGLQDYMLHNLKPDRGQSEEQQDKIAGGIYDLIYSDFYGEMMDIHEYTWEAFVNDMHIVSREYAIENGILVDHSGKKVFYTTYSQVYGDAGVLKKTFIDKVGDWLDSKQSHISGGFVLNPLSYFDGEPKSMRVENGEVVSV